MVQPRLLGIVVVVMLVAALLMIAGCAAPALADTTNSGAADDLAALIFNLIGLAVVLAAVVCGLAGVMWLISLGAEKLPLVTEEELRRAFPRAPHLVEDAERKS